ncbi:AraC family transcriptional regulator [Ramlibacter ginsenosidimutans]|uniref:AraC family transcriptional regulator n=1 Tax=Ramlibacter ginsenosidimutans TaxID=502333 RepID=UPI00191F0EB7|nr:AraC family transcriptional regulator [Ramlibacter ginsenosidimutans]
MVKFAAAAPVVQVDAAQIFRHVGVDPQCMVAADLFVPQDCLTNVLDATQRRTGFAGVGLLVGASWRMSDFGPLALLLEHLPTLRHAFGEFERYRHLRSQTITIRIQEAGVLAVIQMDVRSDRGKAPGTAVELTVASLMALLHWFLGQGWHPREVRFAHSAPSDLTLHRRVFGCNVEFGCDFDGVVVHTADLDHPNPFGDVNLARYAREFLDLQPAGTRAPTTLAVRRSLELLLPQGRCAVEQVALQMGTTARTLQRRLSEEGTDFSALLNDCRSALARRYLADARYPVGQVATLLGFSDASAFTRWFGARFGASPRQWRSEAGK